LHFLKFINEFTLNELTDKQIKSDVLIRNIEQKNQELKNKGLKGIILSLGFKEFIRLLDNNSMDEVKEMNIYNKTTFYRFKKQLALIGYVRQSLLSRPIPYGKDFAEYYMNVNTERFEVNLKCGYFNK